MRQRKAGFEEIFRDDLRTKNGAETQYLSPKRVKELSQIDNFHGLLALGKTILELVSAIIICAYFWHPLVITIIVIFMASRQHAIFVIVHEAAHFRLFTSRTLNNATGTLLGATLGISMHHYRGLHRLHHNHLYQQQDPDIPLHYGYPRGVLYLVQKLLRDLIGLTTYKTYSYFWGLPSAPYLDQKLSSSSISILKPDTASRRRDQWASIVCHAMALAISLSSGYGSIYLFCWLLPLTTVLPAILRLRAICEHGAVSDYSSPLTSSRTNLGPKWLIWLFFPHNVNYHLEHHIYPSIPQYNLRKCHNELIKNNKFQGSELRSIQETLKIIFAEPNNPIVRS